MNTLYLIGSLMALVAMSFVAVPLLRKRKTSAAPAQDAANVAIYADQLVELDKDLNNGLITQAQFDHAKPELERRLLQDVSADVTPAPAATQQTSRWVGIILSVLIPIVAVSVYFLIGKPEALDASVAQRTEDPQRQQVEAMLPQIEQRLKEQPDDIAAWTMLGRVMMSLQRFPEAADAYGKIAEITPKSAQAFADYADALGMAQDQKLAGKPTQMIAQALKLDPKNQKALYLSGFAAIEAGNNQAAIAQWEKLLAELPPEQKGVEKLRAQIAELRQQAGLPQAAVMEKPTAAPSAGGTTSTASVSGQARLNPALKSFANPEDTVFVYARAVSGPRMPLSMLRIKVKDLPVDFNLDDSMGMTPQMKLSDFPEVVIIARVSKAGSAVSQPGDLEGMSAPVKLGTRNLKIEISRKIE